MYSIDTDAFAREQIKALPDEALLHYAELLIALEMVPWHGHPIAKKNPKGPVRVMSFGGAGMVTYLILEDQLRVDVLKVLWVS